MLMACELERNRFLALQKSTTSKPAELDAAYKTLKQCESVAYQRAEETAEREAREKLYSQQAETAAQYASGARMKDIKAAPEYEHGFDISKFLPKIKSEKGPNVGVIVTGVLGGGILLLVILYFLMKDKGDSRYSYPPTYK